MSQTSYILYLHNQVFAWWHRLNRIFSSQRFYFSTSHGLAIFFLTEVLFFCKPTWSSNCGGKWHRPPILRAWNRWSGPGIKPWTHKKIMLQGQGFKAWTYQQDGVYNHTHNCSYYCAYESMHRMHEQVPHRACQMDDRGLPDWPKNGCWTDHSKMMHQSKKICTLQNISFWRYHTMYPFVYTSTDWISPLQDTCRKHTTKIFIMHIYMINAW